MKVVICDTKDELGKRAADDGAALIREAIEERGQANIILATGVSQFEMLKVLVKAPEVKWEAVTGFHLDEYVGMKITHKASFRKYLKERFVQNVPIAEFHYIDGEGDARAECSRLGEIIGKHPVDAAFVGIGENGHLAFNDPPADFETEEPFIVVELDETCRKQQLGEGWFESFADVPKSAISMSIRQIMKARAIICAVPDSRKAKAVKNCLEGPISPEVPASILQQHEGAVIYLDRESSSLLSREH